MKSLNNLFKSFVNTITASKKTGGQRASGLTDLESSPT